METPSQQPVDESSSPSDQPSKPQSPTAARETAMSVDQAFQEHLKLLDDAVEEAVKSFTENIEEHRGDRVKEVMEWVGEWEAQDGPPSGADIEHVMELLGDIFFLGKFQEGRVPFRWMTDEDRTTAYGFTQPGIDYRPQEIVVRPSNFSKTRRASDYRSVLTGTLLHEQCHAFCALVSHEAGYRFDKRRNLNCETGHTAPWFFLATHVEIMARQLFPDLDIRLRSFSGLLQEVSARRKAGDTSGVLGASIPTRKEWQALAGRYDADSLNGLSAGLPPATRDIVRKAYPVPQ